VATLSELAMPDLVEPHPEVTGGTGALRGVLVEVLEGRRRRRAGERILPAFEHRSFGRRLPTQNGVVHGEHHRHHQHGADGAYHGFFATRSGRSRDTLVPLEVMVTIRR